MKINKQELLNCLDENNYKLANLLTSLKIKKINLINCGNSIASGYSINSFTKPLLLRNENIENIVGGKGIILKRYNFSRPEDNNDEHIYSWLINDIPLNTISRLNRFDIVQMNAIGIDDKQVDEYYPLNDETTLKKLLNEDDSSNIIVYNGATGSFLDNITRGGKHFLTYGIKRDCTSIESFLKYIQEINREQNKNIQVYLCGAPKLLGLSDTFINPKLKKISQNYANVTYVENFPKKFLYRLEEGKITPDLHYDDVEYLILNYMIIKEINDNYLINKIFIDIDRKLYLINKQYQLGNINKDQMLSLINDCITQFIKNVKIIIKNKTELKKILELIKNYLLERSQYDFYYIGKSNIKKIKS